MNKEWIYRALYYTMELIEKEKKINDHLSKLKIERWEREIKQMGQAILDMEEQ